MPGDGACGDLAGGFGADFFHCGSRGTASELCQRSLARSAQTVFWVRAAPASLTGEGEIEGGPGVVAVLVVASDEIMARPFIFEPLSGNETNLGVRLSATFSPRPERKIH